MLKTLSFACIHFCVAFTVAYILTGSLVVGGLVALVEPLCNTLAYHFHEMAWARWGKGAIRRGPTDGEPGRYGAGSFGCVH